MPSEGSPIKRRDLLFGAGAGVTLAALTGCKVQTSDNSAGSGSSAIKIPDPKVSLPKDDIKFRWMDGGGNRTLFQKPLFTAYSDKHDNIKVQYDATNMDTVNETIPLGVRNKTAPDVFAIGNKIQHRQSIEDGWCQPIDDLIPDFEQWKSAFPEGAFVPNVHVFDSKTYSFPISGSGDMDSLLIYNPELLKQADVDPASDLKTWDQFRSAAKKIAKAGNGKFYGLMNSRTPVKIVEGLLSTAGFYSGLDLRTGKYAYDKPIVLEVCELIKAMKSDGSIWPDYASISAADARGRMPNGVAGLQVDGNYSFADWEQADFTFGFQAMPTPEGKSYTDMYNFVEGSNVFVYAKSKYAEVAGDLFSYIGSLDGQAEMVRLTKGALLPAIPKASEQATKNGAQLDPNFSKARKMSSKYMRAAPSPTIRNPDISQVEVNTITPSFSDLLGGMLTGQVSNVKKSLHTLNDKLNSELDRAIAVARKKGAKVSRSDYVFPNWDPSKDYTTADYKQL